VHKSWFRWLFKKISEVAPQISIDIVFGPLSEMLGNHWAKVHLETHYEKVNSGSHFLDHILGWRTSAML